MRISTLVAVPMSNVAWWLVLLLAILQAVFMVMEIFFWDFVATHLAKFKGIEVSDTWKLGANMGLYNGFLAAGLAWSLFAPRGLNAGLALFFVGCVFVAGVFGWFTVSWELLIAQTLPAACPLVALLIHSPSQ